MKFFLFTILFLSALSSCISGHAVSHFIYVNKKGQFVRDEKPYYFIGTNFWYGAIIGSEGEGGNRIRLCRELDYLKSIGVENLRVLVGADGENGVQAHVEPSLQIAPNVYNDTILAGLDFFMNELRKRKMTAVLYLNNSWEWSGGYSAYLEWMGYGKIVNSATNGWSAYMNYVKRFLSSDSAKALFAEHVRYIVTRTNRYSQIRYVDDPTIMSWQIGNEPRAFSEENKELLCEWLSSVAALIKSLDPNHLISSGSEGKQGCEQDLMLFEKIHSNSNIDYLTIHIWPYNWQWIKADSLEENLLQAKENTKKYIEEHLSVARKCKKPLVLEEFGFPRDSLAFSKKSHTFCRDEYYQFVFDIICRQRKNEGLLSGCNFWAWGGFANLNSTHTYWKKGDDYTGDPPQEEQGLNSVFATDHTTIQIIKTNSKMLE